MRLWRDRRPKVEERAANLSLLDPSHFAAFWSPTWSGQVVSPERALRNAAVSACVRVLTTTAATLPVDAIRAEGPRRRIVSPTPPIVANPAASVRRRAWVAQVLKGLLLYGNAYGLIAAADRRGYPTIVETLPNDRVHWRQGADRVWRVSVDGTDHDLWPLGDVVHFSSSAFLLPGSPVAQSPAELARESIGTSLAAEEYGARFFGDSGHPNVLVKSKQDLTQDQAKKIKDNIKAAWVGREPAVVGAGLDVEFPNIDPSSSQFLDLIRFEVEQACRFFGVPPAMVYAAVSGQNVTYANVIDADNQYLKHSASIWLTDVEDVWSTFLADPGMSVRFNVDAFLRMDAKGRHALYTARLRAKTMTVNEVRALEDEDPFPDEAYDEPGVPGGFDRGGTTAQNEEV